MQDSTLGVKQPPNKENARVEGKNYREKGREGERGEIGQKEKMDKRQEERKTETKKA